jgi:hypothetical protein
MTFSTFSTLLAAKEPIEKIRMIHKEMIQTIQSIEDYKKRAQYLLTLCNTANKVN